MRRPNSAPRKYREYRPKGLAVTRIDVKEFYLGKYGSPESWERNHRLLAERAVGVTCPSGDDPVPDAPGTTISELILAFWKHAQEHYRHADGSPTEELGNLKAALRPLRQLHGSTPAAEFGPLKRRAVRDEMVRADLMRTTINGRINTTALSRSPTAARYPGELDPDRVQTSSLALGVALSRHGVAMLGTLELLRRSLQQLPRRTQVQPPERDQRRHRRVHLAFRQLRVFPPQIPVALARGTGHSHSSGPGGVSTPGTAVPRTGPARSHSSGPRSTAPLASARRPPAASPGFSSPRVRCSRRTSTRRCSRRRGR